MDEDSHSTDLSASTLGCTWRRSFNNFIGSVGFYWGQSYLATLVTPQNCTKCLEILLFLYNLHILASDQKNVLSFRATLSNSRYKKQLWMVLWKRLSNVLRYSWKHFGKSRATCGKPYFGSRSLVKSVKTRQSISQLARAFFKQSERYWVWQRGQFLLFSHINTR